MSKHTPSPWTGKMHGTRRLEYVCWSRKFRLPNGGRHVYGGEWWQAPHSSASRSKNARSCWRLWSMSKIA